MPYIHLTMLNLYLVRHGATSDNAHGRLCGTRDPLLTPEGHRMAEALAEAYGATPWQAVCASPLSRARQTAEPLAAKARVTVKIEAGLAELSYGAWEGLTPEQAEASAPDYYAAWTRDPAALAPPQGETAAQVAVRAGAVIARLQREHPTGNVLCVSHKSTARILICSLLGIDLRRFKDRVGQPAGALSVLQLGPNGPKLLRLGDTSHLSPALRSVAERA